MLSVNTGRMLVMDHRNVKFLQRPLYEIPYGPWSVLFRKHQRKMMKYVGDTDFG